MIHYPGIYQILNKVNNKRYIGSTVNLYKRKHQHLKELKNNKHGNRFLQRSWNKYGADAFELTTLIKCAEKDLFFYEDLIVKGYKSNDPDFGYNLREVVESNKGMLLKYHAGDKYGRVTLLKPTSVSSKWVCECDCGTIKELTVYPLKAGITKSCGCWNTEVRSTRMLALQADPVWRAKMNTISSITMKRTRQKMKEHSVNG